MVVAHLSCRHGLSIAPGRQAGGHATRHAAGPARADCSRGTPVGPLPTADGGEGDGVTSRVPVGDRHAVGVPSASIPAGACLGRGLRRTFTCPAGPAHPHRLNFR
ncbi:hypothetical protein [Streptomyces sp. NPDC052701]|uniref:hypothetical protein n=1 Tax=Streptomyces sp. NPDC052701 TaxID=3155533 RepID=UPI0034376734